MTLGQIVKALDELRLIVPDETEVYSGGEDYPGKVVGVEITPPPGDGYVPKGTIRIRSHG